MAVFRQADKCSHAQAESRCFRFWHQLTRTDLLCLIIVLGSRRCWLFGSCRLLLRRLPLSWAGTVAISAILVAIQQLRHIACGNH